MEEDLLMLTPDENDLDLGDDEMDLGLLDDNEQEMVEKLDRMNLMKEKTNSSKKTVRFNLENRFEVLFYVCFCFHYNI